MITHLRSDHPDDLRKAENERKGKNGVQSEKLAVGYLEHYQSISALDATEEPSAKKANNQNTFFSRFLGSKRQSQPTESIRSEIVNYEAIIMAGRPDVYSMWPRNAAKRRSSSAPSSL
ncbi:hypothetical protein L5515_009202 [Caenorhabditis briggsae]|uniref:Uncharacterized protein n=1 Tax=Caenorhabditis briggsae TaxID=6238 RepID=A0AAE9JLZ6_CAEBR|nr:hypothetical protein L5515_009202 [Caenorhabditis briggsae]